MSDDQDLNTIEYADLDTIHGGDGSHSLRTSVGFGPLSASVDERITRDDYELCLANNQRQAAEAHPDTRSFFGRLLGYDTDRNAPARIADERRGEARCLAAIRR